MNIPGFSQLSNGRVRVDAHESHYLSSAEMLAAWLGIGLVMLNIIKCAYAMNLNRTCRLSGDS